jgi:hypothetical protein
LWPGNALLLLLLPMLLLLPQPPLNSPPNQSDRNIAYYQQVFKLVECGVVVPT